MPIDVDLYQEHTRGRGLVEVLLRGHLWAEKHLISLIEADTRHPDALELDRMTFFRKMKLAEGLGLLAHNEVESLTTLNSMRNRLAHDLAGHPMATDIETLESKMSQSQIGLADKLMPFYDEGDEDASPEVALSRRLAVLILALITEMEQHSMWHAYWREHRDAMEGYRTMVAIMERIGATPETEDQYRAALGIPDPPTSRDAIIWRHGTPAAQD